jgi:hypothetical protein
MESRLCCARLPDRVTVRHAVAGNEGSAATVDWSIGAPGYPVLLLEVKNRIGDLIESFETIKHLDAHEGVPSPRHDHAVLFRSVQHQFKSRQPDEAIQAVWIKTGLKRRSSDLRLRHWNSAASTCSPGRLGGGCVRGRHR